MTTVKSDLDTRFGSRVRFVSAAIASDDLGDRRTISGYLPRKDQSKMEFEFSRIPPDDYLFERKSGWDSSDPSILIDRFMIHKNPK